VIGAPGENLRGENGSSVIDVFRVEVVFQKFTLALIYSDGKR
jgi:hypothetical protein